MIDRTSRLTSSSPPTSCSGDSGRRSSVGVAVSLARQTILALSTNAWLRDHATKTPFVRRAVSAFMPGEQIGDALAAARGQED